MSALVTSATSIFLILGLLRTAWTQRHERHGKE